ncbi:hypothetical protein LINGRAHAP2_LOCUS16141 [Linum grandiflorum]
MTSPLRMLLRRLPHGRRALPHPPLHRLPHQRPCRLPCRNLRLPIYKPHLLKQLKSELHDMCRCQGQEFECGSV